MIEALVLSNLFLIVLLVFPVLAVLSYVTEELSSGLTTLAIIILLIFAWWFLSFNVISFTINNFTTVAYSTLAYLVIGILYSFLKYYLFLLKQKDNGASKNLASKIAYERIATWIVYWPLSLIWTLLSDLLTRLVNKFIAMFKGIYDSILNHVFKDENEKKTNDH